MCTIREVLRRSTNALDRNNLIRETVHALGFKRTGTRLTAAIDDAVRRAVRRGIAFNERGRFTLQARAMDDYTPEFLKTQLLACIGQRWVERAGVASRFARWMGFARTGPVIERIVKGLVASLLRAGKLKKRDDEVHRA